MVYVVNGRYDDRLLMPAVTALFPILQSPVEDPHAASKLQNNEDRVGTPSGCEHTAGSRHTCLPFESTPTALPSVEPGYGILWH